MNEKFALYSTGVAFSLTLSKLQCYALLKLEELPLKEATVGLEVYNLQGLERRGLVWWRHMKDGTPNGFQGLTEAGRDVCRLLRQAGITRDSCITLSVEKRLKRGKP